MPEKTVVNENGHTFLTLDDGGRFQSPYTPVSGETNVRFFGSYTRGDMTPGPVGFLADVDPEMDVDTHFHNVDQFQMMFGGSDSWYQRHSMPKVLLHYSDAYTVYGPFGVGKEEPLEYLTLRGSPSNVHGTMPGARDKLLYIGRRHQSMTLDPYLKDDLPDKGDAIVDMLLIDHTDGLATYLARIGPGTEFTAPEGELRTGRYTVVLKGEIHHDGKVFGPKSVGWTQGEAPDLTFSSGPEGAIVAFAYLPFPATPVVRLAELEKN